MITVTPIPTSAEVLENVTAGNGALTVLDEVMVGEGDQLTQLVLDRYDWRDKEGKAEPGEFVVTFNRGTERIDTAGIPATHIDVMIAALARLKRAWNPEGSRVQALPPFDVSVNGGIYMADTPMVPLEEHEYDAVGLHVQAYRYGESTAIDRLVGIAASSPHDYINWPFYFTPERALQLAEDIRDTALALIADAEVAA